MIAASVKTMAAQIGGGGDTALSPPPALGFSGAAALDGDGKFAGIAQQFAGDLGKTGDVTAVLGAAERLRLPADALDPAETAGLIRAVGGVLTFRHPLVRSVLYEGAPLRQRQRAHAALAEALRGDQDADRRIWHQAMATLTGDEEVAAALEASARRAQQRAGHASAATRFARAAALTADQSRVVPRLAAAAQAAWDAGQAERARALIARAFPLAGAHDRARLLHLSGVIEASCGSIARAVITQLEGADGQRRPLADTGAAAPGCRGRC